MQQAVRAPATEMLRNLAAISDRVASAIAAEVPEVRDAPPELQAAIREAGEAEMLASINALLQNLPTEQIAPSAQASRTTRAMARARLPLTAILRTYRIGWPIAWQAWAEAVRRAVPERDQEAVLDEGSVYMIKWMDRVSELAVHEYEAERDRLTHAASAARTELVELLLAGVRADPEAARRTLGYALDRGHVAIVLWTRADPAEDVLKHPERAARAMAGDGRPLLLPVGTRTLWAWMHELSSTEVPDDVHGAVGEAAEGQAGFRRSHLDAIEARRVAGLLGTAPGTITHFSEVAVISLATQDVGRARSFVERVLGELAGGGEGEARLRETLSVHFAARWNHRETARRLSRSSC